MHAMWYRTKYIVFMLKPVFRRRGRPNSQRAIFDANGTATSADWKSDFPGKRLLPKFALRRAVGSDPSAQGFLQYSCTLLCLGWEPCDILSSRISCPPKRHKLEMSDEALKPAIAEIFERSYQRFGARKIRAKLQQNGYTVSERRILRLMKELGLSNKMSHPKLNSANDRQYRYYQISLSEISWPMHPIRLGLATLHMQRLE